MNIRAQSCDFDAILIILPIKTTEILTSGGHGHSAGKSIVYRTFPQRQPPAIDSFACFRVAIVEREGLIFHAGAACVMVARGHKVDILHQAAKHDGDVTHFSALAC